ncbi:MULTISPECIES: zinc-dependent metalloprotease [unclassified Microbacterium]|uniref:zinc-dependent metalloprotease n=1 Tax=Microbacterium TaxID=33882 RepID=UPI003BA0D1EC
MADDDRTPDDDLQELLRRLMNGGAIDPEQLSRMAGMPVDPATLSQMMQQFQGMFAGAQDGSISWDATKRQALHIANQDGLGVTDGQRTDLDQAFALAGLWLGEVTTLSPTAELPRAITRGQWVEQTLPVWQEVAEPVATSIADALTEALRSQVPEEMQDIVQSAGRLMRGVGGTLFATQLGQVVGKLSLEVVSGADVGIPVIPAGSAVLLPQNFAELGAGLEIPEDQLALYIAARELASARLFRHAKWLRLHILSQIDDYARGISVDTDALEEMASRLDPSNPEELRQALESGALLPQQSEAQKLALARLENLLALVEGWIDVVTADATARVPHLERIAEAIRRRRAEGGPAEDALGALVGLRLRPRRLREAAAMWRAVGDAVGIAARDSLWDYPDLMPTSEDIDDPAGLIARLEAQARGEQPEADDMDDALARLLAEEAERTEGEADRDAPASPSDDDEGHPRPEGDQPV